MSGIWAPPNFCRSHLHDQALNIMDFHRSARLFLQNIRAMEEVQYRNFPWSTHAQTSSLQQYYTADEYIYHLTPYFILPQIANESLNNGFFIAQ